jgi:hypothetical protein
MHNTLVLIGSILMPFGDIFPFVPIAGKDPDVPHNLTPPEALCHTILMIQGYNLQPLVRYDPDRYLRLAV